MRKEGRTATFRRLIGRRATPVVDFVNRETEAHEAARFVVRLWCFFFFSGGRVGGYAEKRESEARHSRVT
jgi:hypothetical protein